MEKIRVPSVLETFVWGRLKQSIAFFWAAWWRSTLVSFGVSAVVFALGFLALYFSESTEKAAIHTMVFFGLSWLALSSVWLAYVNYKVLYVKVFKSFDRSYLATKPDGVWSLAFWVVYVGVPALNTFIVTSVAFVLGGGALSMLSLATGVVDEETLTIFMASLEPSALAEWESLLLTLFFSGLAVLYFLYFLCAHILFHKGAYRFVPEQKLAK